MYDGVQRCIAVANLVVESEITGLCILHFYYTLYLYVGREQFGTIVTTWVSTKQLRHNSMAEVLLCSSESLQGVQDLTFLQKVQRQILSYILSDCTS